MPAAPESVVAASVRRLRRAQEDTARLSGAGNDDTAEQLAAAEEEQELSALVGADTGSLADLERKLHVLARLDLDDFATASVRPSWGTALLMSALLDVRRLVDAQVSEAGR